MDALNQARLANELAVAEAERVANEVEAQISAIDAVANEVSVNTAEVRTVEDTSVSSFHGDHTDTVTVTFSDAQREALRLAENAAHVERLRI